MNIVIGLQCTKCKRRNYTTTKNKKNNAEKLKRNKFCNSCRVHTEHKEVK